LITGGRKTRFEGKHYGMSDATLTELIDGYSDSGEAFVFYKGLAKVTLNSDKGRKLLA
jgi:hypothetical protein